jgi:regulator of protease activity HflC (stomatin/prohibitin superfamily)
MNGSRGVNPKKVAIGIGSIIGLIVLIAVGTSIWSDVDQGYYQIKQSFWGNMSVHAEPGPYMLLWGKYEEYHQADKMLFCTQTQDKGCNRPDYGPVMVRFRDGSAATVSGYIQYKMPQTPDKQLLLHRDYKSYANVKGSLIYNTIKDSLIKTAALMKAEESYATKRAEFNNIAGDQLRKGIFAVTARRVKRKDADGNEFIDQLVEIKSDKNGNPRIHRESPFGQYNLGVVQFIVSDIDYDDKIRQLIDKKKEAEQEKVVARANAERAKQDAITEREQGKARVAKAQADALVLKKTAVIEAEKQKEVAREMRLKAEQDAKAEEVRGRANALVAKLKVAAGLSPRERAEFDMKTAIGVAEKLSQVKLPASMVIAGGGNGKGSSVNPFDAIGLEALHNLSQKIKRTK